MLFNQFDHIKIISLVHRNDRRREIAQELTKVGVQIDGERVAFFDACRVSELGGFYSAGAHGCYLSHLEILEQASGSVLILEDDCDFEARTAHYIVPKCDIFYGGYDAVTADDPSSSDIVGSHMMGYFKPNDIAFYLRRVLEDDDFRGNVPPPSIDGAIVWYRRAHPDTRTVFAVPKLAHQRPSKTDIGGDSFIDRVPAVAAIARRLKRSLRIR